jgi:hypothetical protein
LSSRRGALKSHLVWSAYAGGIRSLAAARKQASPSHQTPPAPGSCSGVSGRRPSHEPRSGGVGCRREPTFWGFGNPEVLPKGPDVPNARSARVLALNLGELQIWVVDPLFSTASVQLPPGVDPVAPGIPFRRLPKASHEPDLASVVVDNREANDHVTSDCSSHPGEAIATPTDHLIRCSNNRPVCQLFAAGAAD